MLFLLRPAKLLCCLYVLVALINDFFETDCLRIYWIDFHNFLPSHRYLFMDDRSEPLFFDPSGVIVVTTKFG